MAEQQRPGEGSGTLSFIEAEDVRRQLQKILESASFTRAARMQRFLSFVVEHRLSANNSSSDLKEVIIGVAVFDRSPEYDPKLDPIVRVEARRLRAKLFEYYQVAGQSDSLVIELPTGGYTPAWHWRPVEEPILASPPPHTPPSLRRPLPAAGMAASALVLTALAGWWLLSRGQSEDPRGGPQLTPTPLTSYPGREYTPTFSPDGGAVAYTWEGPSQDNFDIYVEVIGSQKPVRLTSHPDVELSPRWSPDGRKIAFIRAHADGTSEVMTISAAGGPASRVCANEIYYRPNTRPLEWSSDGKYLFIAALNGSRGLVRVDTVSGSVLRITDPPPEQVDLGPSLSPDGSKLAFTHVEKGMSTLNTVKLNRDYAPASSPQQLQVSPCAKSLCVDPEWTADSKFILFVSNHQGGMRLWSLPENGGTAQLLSSMGDKVLTPEVARSGRRMAFARDLLDTNIWRLDLTSLSRRAAITQSTRLDQRPRVSPDGSMLAFESDRTGFTEIWVASSDGSNARCLTNFKQEGAGSPSWSPDGSRLLFDSHHEGQSEIYEISVTGGEPRRLTNHPSADILPEYSPDRGWIYFTSSRSGQYEIWRMPVHGGPALQVTRNGGFGSRLSSDGRVVYYTRQEDLRPLWSSPSNGGLEKRICDSVLGRSYEVVEGGVYFISADNLHRSTLEFLDARTGSQRKIYTFDRSVAPGLSVSADGRFAYYTQVDQSGSDLMLVEGW